MKRIYCYTLLLLVAFSLAACGGKKAAEETPAVVAQKYFQKGEKQYEEELYDDAIESWEKVRDSYYSPELSMLAELKIAETYYVLKRYDDAAVAFNAFLEQHPNDYRTPTILYRLGLCYYEQIRPADRDQSYTRKAMETFQTLATRFPNDKNAQEAGYLIQRCKTRLAENDVHVGTYYLKRKLYKPAITRFEKVLNGFPDYYYRDELYFYLGQAYLGNEEKEKADAMFNQLFEQFPGSERTEEAKELLEDLAD